MRTPDFRNENAVPRRPHHVSPSLASVRLILVSELMGQPMPGCSDAGLAITVNMDARVLRRAGVHTETWKARNWEELSALLDGQVNARRPITHLVINNPRFIPPDRIAEMATKWPDIEFVQLNHSGLAYLSIDDWGVFNIKQIMDMQTSMHNIRLACNNPRFVKWINGNFGADCLLLPNLYDVDTFKNPVSPRACCDPLRVGSFGAGRPWKNQLTAAEAAVTMARRLGVKLELYVNTGHWDADGKHTKARWELFEGLPGVQIVPVPWDVWAKFRHTVATMDIMLSPSFDETFCVVVADGIAEGVPSVVTGAMEWTPEHWWATPWDQASIAHVGMALLHDRIGAIHDGRQALTEYVANGTRKWTDYLCV